MTKKHLFSPGLPVPVFIKLDIEDDLITLASYEELARSASEGSEEKTQMVGRITGLPGGRPSAPYNLSGLKRLMKDLPDSMAATTPGKVDGHRVVKARNFAREIVKGEKLEPSLKGRDFVLLSTAVLSRNDALFRGAWKDMSVWIFEIDSDGVLQTPHNAGMLMSVLGGFPNRLTSILDRYPVLTIFQAYGESPFSEASFNLKAHPSYGFSATKQSRWKQITGDEIKKLAGAMLPRLRVASAPKTVSATTPAVVELEAFDPETGKVFTDYPLTVELDVKSGYVPKTTLKLEKGRTQFRALGLGLDKGDTVVVQAGLGYSMYKLDIELTVS